MSRKISEKRAIPRNLTVKFENSRDLKNSKSLQTANRKEEVYKTLVPPE